MFDKIFELVDGVLIIRKKSIRIEPPYKEILSRDKGSPGDFDGRKKLFAFEVFKYIYYIADYDSYPNKKGYNDKEKVKYAMSNCNLPADWKPDLFVNAAIKLYQKEQLTPAKEAILELLKVFNGFNKSVKLIRSSIDTIRESKAEGELTRDDIKELIDLYKDTINLSTTIPEMSISLKTAINKLEADNSNKTKSVLRGTTEEVPDSMNPDKEFDLTDYIEEEE